MESLRKSGSVSTTLINAATAQPVSTAAGPPTASSTVASSGPASTLKLSQYQSHRLPTISSDDDLACAGTSTAAEGRSVVTAPNAITAAATSTATGRSAYAATAAPP